MEKMGFTSRKKRFHDVPYDSVVSRLDNKENHDAPGSQIRGKGKALSKLISGFAWSRGSTSPSEKSRQQGVTPFVLRDENNDNDDDADDAASEDLPMGFPTPPPKLSSAPSRHPAATFGKQHSESAVTHATSLSSISMSSFASTALFEESDSSQSEATSVSVASSSNSSPESSPSRSRMWKVKGLVRDSPQLGSQSSSTHIRRPKASANPRLSLVVEDTEAETRRSSTPVPSCVQMMLAEPETPPRSIRRSSASSQPYPGSPPFDPRAHNKAETAVPAPVRPVEPVRPSSSDGSSSAGEADDEVSPPRLKANEELIQQRKRSSGAWGSSASLKAKARIPSLKFEGISMDAMFAEVERNITVTDLTGANGLSGLGIVPSAPLLPVKPNKRISVLPTPVPPTILSSKNLPKRSSSIRKPPPLNLSLAPLLSYAGCGPAALSPTSIYSQSSPRSPPLAGAWSATPTPTRPTFAAVEKSPSSGLLPSPIRDRAAAQRTPSPALSSTSTLRGPASPIPAFSVHPPTPPPHSRRSSLTKPVQRLSPILEPAQEQEQEQPAAETTAESISVKIVPQKRYVRMSSRSGYQRQRRSTTQIMSAPARSPVFAARTAPMAPILEAAPTFSEQDESVSPSAMSEPQQQPVRKVALPEILIREPTVPDLVSAHDESMTTPKMDSAPWSPVSPASSLETDMSEEGSDALEHMLHKLEQPHTPPPAERSSTPLATAQAISRGPSPLLAGRDDENDQLLLELDDVLSGRKRLSSVSCLPTPASSPFLSSGQPETIFEDEDEHAPRSTIDDLCFEDTDIERPLSIAASLDDEQPLHGRTALIEALKASTFESDDEDDDKEEEEDQEELDESSMTGLAISSLTFYQDELPTDEEEEATSWSRSESINSLASYDTMTTNASSEHGHAVVVMAERISNAYDPTLVSASNRQLYTASVGIAL